MTQIHVIKNKNEARAIESFNLWVREEISDYPTLTIKSITFDACGLFNTKTKIVVLYSI